MDNVSYGSFPTFGTQSWQQQAYGGSVGSLYRTAMPTAAAVLGAGVGGGALPPPPLKFIFRPRTGRINWRVLHALDLERVVREGDVETIQTYLDNITFARFGKEDVEAASDDGLVKLVQLAQLCMEFLSSTCCSSQHLLHGLVERVRVQGSQLKADSRARSAKQSGSKPARRNLSRDPEAHPLGPPRKCPHCPKRFQTEQYLYDHIVRRHDYFNTSEKIAPPPEPVAAPPVAKEQMEPIVINVPPPQPVPVAEIVDSIKAATREQLESVKSGLADLETLRHEFQKVVSDVNRVAGDVAQLKNIPPPAPVAPIIVTPAASEPRGDENALMKRNDEFEKKITLLLESNSMMLLNKIEETKMVMKSPHVEQPSPGGAEALAAAQKAMQEQIKEQMEPLTRLQEEIRSAIADNGKQMLDELDAVSAKVKAAEAAAAAAAEAAAAAAAAAKEQAGNVAVRETIVVHQPVVVPEVKAPPPVPTTTIEETAPPPPTPAPAPPEEKEALPTLPPAPVPSTAVVEKVEESTPFCLTPAGLSPPEEAEQVRKLGLSGPPAAPLVVAESFSQLWDQSLRELQSQEEQLRFMLAMTQERTRPRHGVLSSQFDEEFFPQGLSSEDLAEAVTKKVPQPTNPFKKPAKKSVGCFGESRPKAKSKAKSEAKPKPQFQADNERHLEVVQMAVSNGLVEFFRRCRGPLGAPDVVRTEDVPRPASGLSPITIAAPSPSPVDAPVAPPPATGGQIVVTQPALPSGPPPPPAPPEAAPVACLGAGTGLDSPTPPRKNSGDSNLSLEVIQHATPAEAATIGASIGGSLPRQQPQFHRPPASSFGLGSGRNAPTTPFGAATPIQAMTPTVGDVSSFDDSGLLPPTTRPKPVTNLSLSSVSGSDPKPLVTIGNSRPQETSAIHAASLDGVQAFSAVSDTESTPRPQSTAQPKAAADMSLSSVVDAVGGWGMQTRPPPAAIGISGAAPTSPLPAGLDGVQAFSAVSDSELTPVRRQVPNDDSLVTEDF